jgi:2-(1,2-epoxy-1,2-dihydrophenyl)acetyl-CoA isomerase
MNDKLPTLRVEDRIAVVQFNDPATFNGLGPDTFERLGQIFQEIETRANKDIDAAVLTGSGKAFSSGAELNAMFQMVPEGKNVGQHIAEWTRDEGTPVVMQVHRCPVPLVSAVNGVAAGIGMSFALLGDVVLAGKSASFVVPFFTKLGIVPDGGLTWELSRLVGRARASAMCLLGERLGATEAANIGLIWRCVEDGELLTAAIETARKLASLPVNSCPEMRAALDAAHRNSFEDQYHYELHRNEELLNRPAFQEGLRAFSEKRSPRFRG